MSASFWSRTKLYPLETALIDEKGQELQSNHLHDMSNKVSNGLISYGLQRGDVVATLLPSGADLIVLMLATRQIGLYLLPLNPRAGIAELKYLVKDSAPKLVIVSPTCIRLEVRESVLHQVADRTKYIDPRKDTGARLSELFPDSLDTAPKYRVSGDILSYTSGTTGLPRAVLREIRQVSPENALQPMLDWYVNSFNIDLESRGAFLSATHVYYSGPMSFASYALHLGRTLVLMPQWNARVALSLIARHRITEMFLVPYQLADLIRERKERSDKYDLGSLKTIIHGSAPCLPDLKQRALDVFGDIVFESYGATEVAGTVATPRDARLFRGTVGRARPPHEVRILDDFQQTCPPGQIGKIYMKMLPGMEFAYKGDVEATKACQEDGFATAGDIGFLNDIGYLFLVGRNSDVINCRGEKILPSVVENAAAAHACVLDAAAFEGGCSGEEGTVHLAVKLSSSGQTIAETVKEISILLGTVLRRAEVPTLILVVNEIPREQSGKLRRRGLDATVRKAAFFEMPGFP